jgi:replicative DNA helicase
VRLQDKRANYSGLLLPTTEAQIKDEEKGLPGSLKTGFTISGEELLLPGGAITVYAGATGHGKTVMAINTALNVASAYPDKKFVFFTYEERASAILQYFLNTYVDRPLNSSQSANRRVLQDYFKTGSTQYLSSESLDYFQAKKDEFFKTYIETGRILVKYVSLNSEELTSAIRYLHKEEPNIAGVFIDYFQLLNLPGGVKRAERINSRQEELKRICIALKDVAVDTGLPLCLTAQFNREVYNLLDIHPTKIREAADIEQIVNTLVGLWNLGKKDVAKETTKGNENDIQVRTGGAQSGMYVELLKSRDLSTGIYEVLEFNGNTGKVKNSSIKKELH